MGYTPIGDAIADIGIDRIAEIPAGYLGTAKRIGHLADDDIAAIKAILKESLEDSGSEADTP